MSSIDIETVQLQDRGERLLLIGYGRMARSYIERAHEKGISVSVVGVPDSVNSPEMEDLLNPDDSLYRTYGESDEAWISAAFHACSQDRIDAVIAFSEEHVIAAAIVARQHELPGPGIFAAFVSRNKLVQREIFQRYGLPQPSFFLCHESKSALDWSAGRYPLVVKPLGGSGSERVRVVYEPNDILDWLCGSSEPFLIEEFIDGREFSVECILHNGSIVDLNITGKSTTDPPYCVELLHIIPAGNTPESRRKMAEVAADVVEVMKVENGVVHLELKESADGSVAIMEVAVRTPGDYIMDLVKSSRGRDYYSASLDVALGRKPTLCAEADRAACVWFPTAGPGTVIAVEGLLDVQHLKHVVSARLTVDVGDVVRPLRWSDDRIGSVQIAAEDVDQLERTLRECRERLSIFVRADISVSEQAMR
ncbi:ATP-grasp domain-containing protein [Mycobacteroides abscessus]